MQRSRKGTGQMANHKTKNIVVGPDGMFESSAHKELYFLLRVLRKFSSLPTEWHTQAGLELDEVDAVREEVSDVVGSIIAAASTQLLKDVVRALKAVYTLRHLTSPTVMTEKPKEPPLLRAFTASTGSLPVILQRDQVLQAPLRAAGRHVDNLMADIVIRSVATGGLRQIG